MRSILIISYILLFVFITDIVKAGFIKSEIKNYEDQDVTISFIKKRDGVGKLYIWPQSNSDINTDDGNYRPKTLKEIKKQVKEISSSRRDREIKKLCFSFRDLESQHHLNKLTEWISYLDVLDDKSITCHLQWSPKSRSDENIWEKNNKASKIIDAFNQRLLKHTLIEGNDEFCPPYLGNNDAIASYNEYKMDGKDN